MRTVQAYAAQEAGAKLEPFIYELGPLASNDIDIQIEHCGVCHTDLSLRNNAWGMTQFPFVAGHEAVGTVHAGCCLHRGHCVAGCPAPFMTLFGWRVLINVQLLAMPVASALALLGGQYLAGLHMNFQ